MTQGNKRPQQNHWTERGRAASVSNSNATGRPRRSVPSLDGKAVKILGKILVAALLLAVLVVGGFMITVDALHAKSRRQMTQLVSEIRPGMSFHSVTSRLGPESQALTNAVDIESYGTTADPSVVTNSVLHLFVHRAFIFYRICVYTDRDSQTVIYASWKDM